MTPSVKTIGNAFLFLPPEQVKQVRGLMDGTLDPRIFASVQELMTTSWHLGLRRMGLTALDEVLEGFGVEYITRDCAEVFDDSDLVAEYINMGEAYATTIVYSHIHTTDWFVTSMGDFVEAAERRGIKIK